MLGAAVLPGLVQEGAALKLRGVVRAVDAVADVVLEEGGPPALGPGSSKLRTIMYGTAVLPALEQEGAAVALWVVGAVDAVADAVRLRGPPALGRGSSRLGTGIVQGAAVLPGVVQEGAAGELRGVVGAMDAVADAVHHGRPPALGLGGCQGGTLVLGAAVLPGLVQKEDAANFLHGVVRAVNAVADAVLLRRPPALGIGSSKLRTTV